MFSEELYEGLAVSGDRGTLRAEEQASFKPGRGSSSKITVEVPGHAAYDGFDCTFPEAIESVDITALHCSSTSASPKGSRPTKRWCLLCRGAVGYHYGMDGAGVYQDQYGC